jgi:hypothetical protein
VTAGGRRRSDEQTGIYRTRTEIPDLRRIRNVHARPSVWRATGAPVR